MKIYGINRQYLDAEYDSHATMLKEMFMNKEMAMAECERLNREDRNCPAEFEDEGRFYITEFELI